MWVENILSGYALNPDCTESGKQYFIDDYNGGNFPFLPKPIKYLDLAVGYAKERDTATVEVVGFSFNNLKDIMMISPVSFMQ